MSNKVGRPKFADRPVFAFEQEVEQAVARGRSDALITAKYGVSQAKIDAVHSYLGKIQDEEDTALSGEGVA